MEIANVQEALKQLWTNKAKPDDFSTPTLVGVYNEAVVQLERPDDVVKKFRDRPTAIRRISGVLVELTAQAKVDKEPATKTAKPKATALQKAAKAAAKAGVHEDAVGEAAAEALAEMRAAAKPKPQKTGARKRLDANRKLSILVPNPHRVGTKDSVSFAKLTEGMTVGQARAALTDHSYLGFAIRNKYVKVV